MTLYGAVKGEDNGAMMARASFRDTPARRGAHMLLSYYGERVRRDAGAQRVKMMMLPFY